MYSSIEEIIKNTDVMVLSKALTDITGFKAISIDVGELEIYAPVGETMPNINLAELQVLIQKYTLSIDIEDLNNRLSLIYIKTVTDFKFKLLGKSITQEVYDEYILVEEAVNTNNINFFSYDAALLRTSTQVEFDKAKVKVDLYRTELNNHMAMIRSVRRLISNMIETNDTRTVKALDMFDSLNIPFTLTDIQAISRIVK